ncbi:MAG: hypothetical protein ACON3Z_12830 [Bradymonadia bacterium]
MAMESIAVDRNLREVFSELAKYLARTGEVPVGDNVFFRHRSAEVRVDKDMQFVVERSFAGFRWRLRVELSDIEKLINGLTRTWPMERLGTSDVKDAELSEDAVTKILGSLGMSPEADSKSQEPTTDEPKTVQRGHRPLTGLEDASEEDVDFGSISEYELDAFLDAYDSATQAPKPKKPETQDPLEALVASLIASDSPILDELGQLDDLDDDEEDGEEQVDPLSLQSAQSFIELLVKNEKLELVEGETGDELALGLAPMLEAEGRANKKAELIMDWLLDQPTVEDVYLSDDEMVSLIRQW